MTTDGTIDALAEWAEDREDVRALILTSTRPMPMVNVHAYPEYQS